MRKQEEKQGLRNYCKFSLEEAEGRSYEKEKNIETCSNNTASFLNTTL